MRKICNHINVFIFTLYISICISCTCGSKLQYKDVKNDLDKSHAYLKERIKSSYSIPGSSGTKDEAVTRYLQELSKGKTWRNNPYIYSEDEFVNIFLPNSLGNNTMIDHNPLGPHMDMVLFRRSVGEDKIRSVIGGKDFQVLQISWSKNIRKRNALTGYKPYSVVVLVDGQKREIDEIKQVSEHQGKFKVSVIAP
ncbi:MAG: hypothetical protein H7A23_23530 [Leptospiraceae bacterium]|nr:hypothetical protein [Leptospiraceae bacterium]MCP5497535.1 hypothetical protein [Leptospiraceae bacterium]